MYAEIASIGYWLLIGLGWAFILYAIYKIIDTLNFSLYLSVAGVGVTILIVSSYVGGTDQSFPAIATIAMWLMMTLVPLTLFGFFLDAMFQGRKEEKEKSIKQAVADGPAENERAKSVSSTQGKR